jgi:RNA polymerase sigma factor (TIGR02999 family)
MRWILVDHARRRLAKKRDTKRAVLAVSVYGSGQTLSADEVLAISAALERLFRKHPRQGEVVELFIFGGLNHAEIAGVLDVSIPTVERDWRFARAWLSRELRPA